MTYNPNIPQANDNLSISQNDLLINFEQANTRFGTDHYPFNFKSPGTAPYDIAVSADKGKHKQLTLARVSADIGNAGADELGLYNKKTITPAASQEIFLRREAGGTVIQMTAGDPVVLASGTSFLPGGLLIQWGTAVIASGGPYIIVFPTAFLAATVPFSITTSMYRNSNSSADVFFIDGGVAPTNIQFGVRNSSSNAKTINWMAIGTAP